MSREPWAPSGASSGSRFLENLAYLVPGYRGYKEKELRQEYYRLKKEWNESKNVRRTEVTDEDIAYVISRMTKIPLTRANLDDCFGPLSLDRSMFVYSAYGSSPAKFSRDLGAVAWGGFASDRLRYYAALFQGREGLTKTNPPFSGAVVTSSIDTVRPLCDA